MKALIFNTIILLSATSAKAAFERCTVEQLTVAQVKARIAWLNRCIQENNGSFLGLSKDGAQYFSVKEVGTDTESTATVNYPVFGDEERNWAPGELCLAPEDVRFIAVCQWSVTEKVVPPPAPVPAPPAPAPEPAPFPKEERPRADICLRLNC
ncbi:hypothetical protein [Bdellovibrio bacteriovorus]|uniref:Uncharacterized protein n=1 Tax=Bdellovibrio bacteriovorus str. Tiberius TaxID=1069642 RepID=K7YZW3_BDEBC|nr:hypothetical protein [Bdellovibrio bacteriovorus]AFY02275.1 Hypothetical protein Bdt_2592 [Bdellovibrio bacteriovorus str. Tiberius]